MIMVRHWQRCLMTQTMQPIALLLCQALKYHICFFNTAPALLLQKALAESLLLQPTSLRVESMGCSRDDLQQKWFAAISDLVFQGSPAYPQDAGCSHAVSYMRVFLRQ